MRIFLLLVSLISLSLDCFAQTETRWTAYANQGKAHYYNPVEFFKGVPEFFPEMGKINSKNYPQLQAMAEYLAAVGVPVMIGNEAELDSFFDLYMPTIARSPYLDAVPLGINPFAEAGKLYLLHHDFAHHFAGIPGIRYKDLQNPEATRKLITDIVLWKEVFATSQSSSWYLPKYWEWRENPSPEILEQFRQYAQGYYSGTSPMTPEEHVEMVTHFVFGETSEYISLLSKKLSPSSLQKARELGVPRVIPDFSKILGKKLDAGIMSYVTRVAEPIHSYFRPVGHKSFVKYCSEYADMLMQPWYVKWSEDFDVGIPLEELHQRTLNLLQQMREGHPLINPAIGNPSQKLGWEFSFLKTEISLLGRKMREVIQATPYPDKIAYLEQEYETIVQFYRSFSKHNDIQAAKDAYLKLVNEIETRVPIDEYVPWSNRSRDASFKSYWRNPYAVIWQRGDALKNANAPRLSSKKLQSVHDEIQNGRPLPKDLNPIQKSVLGAYQNFIANRPEASTMALETSFEAYQKAASDFVHLSLMPQFPYFHISLQLKSELEMEVKAFEAKMNLMFASTELKANSLILYRYVEDFAKFTYEFIRVSRNGSKATQAAQTYLAQLKKLSNLSPNNSTVFIYTQPPGYSVRASNLMVDILRPQLDAGTHLPKLSLVLPYVSVADWVSTDKIAECNRLLKPNP